MSTRDGGARPDNFALIIGAMKSGTTSLFHLLSQHPEIAAASVKEPKFFSNDDVWAQGWDWYTSLWQWDERVHRVALEASPAYTSFPARPDTPRRIASIEGVSFRFIYIVRDPSRQIESNIRHAMYVGDERSLDHGIPPWMIDLVRYATQLDQYVEIFPRESVFLVTLEEFQREPEAVLRRICTFLGVDEEFEFRRVGERYNAGDAYEIPGWLATLLKEGAAARWLVARIPRNLRYRLRALLPRLARQPHALGRHRLTDGEKAELFSTLAPELRRLEGDYGVDIARWWGADSRVLEG